MTATESLQRLAEHCNGIPSYDTSVDRLAEIGIDPAEFQKARPVRNAFEELSKYLGTVLNEVALISKIATLPIALQTKIQQLADATDSVLEEMYQVLKPGPGPSGGVVPPRWGQQQFESQAASVASRHAELYQVLEPLRDFAPSDVQRQIDELKELVVTAGLERQSTQDTTQQLEKAKKETAAYVLADIIVDELDSAITAHTKSANRWLVFLFISTLVAFRIAWWVNIPDDKILWAAGAIFPQPERPLTALDVTVNLGRKILLISAAFAVPLLALRVYYTNLHNLIVNRQRKISVNAFTKFYALMKDSDTPTKTELVKQAAQTIFAQGNTGFLSKGRDLPLLQMMNAFMKSGLKS